MRHLGSLKVPSYKTTGQGGAAGRFFMDQMSRRQFLIILSMSLASVPAHPIVLAASEPGHPRHKKSLPITTKILISAYEGEIISHRNYVAFSKKAVQGEFPNLAYLFKAFAVSEKIHADNFKGVLKNIDRHVEEPVFKLVVSDTKANLNRAAINEMKKIEQTYPGYLNQLRIESHDQAVVNCMYAWKSHKQHEEKIAEIKRYAPSFFGSVAEELESLKLDFHVCEICGATVDEPPETPCGICNYPAIHCHRIERPA
jgi:rubrerythrin